MINQEETASNEAQKEEVKTQAAETVEEQKPEMVQETKSTDGSKGLDNFDWDTFADETTYSSNQHSELEALYDATL